MDGAGTGATLGDDEVLLESAVREAGALALGFFGSGLAATHKADNTPVSEADLAVDRMLRDRLTAARPGYGWLSEETADHPERLATRRVWIVDPIDGTRAFLANSPDWVVSVALVEDGRPVLGALLNPPKSEFYAARLGAGAFLNGRAIEVSAPTRIEGARMIAAENLLNRKIWREPWPPTTPIWVNAIAYRLALIAAGEADATLALSAKSEWDLAAAALLVQEAGGRVTDAKGVDLRFNQPKPRINGVVAAAPELHALLIARTGPVAAREI